jgi:hypothetical protein
MTAMTTSNSMSVKATYRVGTRNRLREFMECGGRMKWRRRPAYSVIAVVFDQS